LGAAVALVAVSCSGEEGATDAAPRRPHSADELVGRWALVSADRRPPTEAGIRSHAMELRADGTWSFRTQFDEQFEEATAEGQGRWQLEGGSVRYTAGERSGTVSVRFEAGDLWLVPDFVLARGGSQGFETRYGR
jgi:hypothetical protein